MSLDPAGSNYIDVDLVLGLLFALDMGKLRLVKIVALGVLSLVSAVGFAQAAPDNKPVICSEKSVKKDLGEVSFKPGIKDGTSMRAERRSDGWHLNDLNGGDIFLSKDSKGSEVPCITAFGQKTCGDQLPKGKSGTEAKDLSVCPSSDNKNDKDNRKRNHSTCVAYIDGVLYLFPTIPDESAGAAGINALKIDKSKPFLRIGGSLPSDDGTMQTLTIDLDERGHAPPDGSGRLELNAQVKKGTTPPSKVDSLSKTGPDNSELYSKCELGGLSGVQATFDEKANPIWARKGAAAATLVEQGANAVGEQ